MNYLDKKIENSYNITSYQRLDSDKAWDMFVENHDLKSLRTKKVRFMSNKIWMASVAAVFIILFAFVFLFTPQTNIELTGSFTSQESEAKVYIPDGSVITLGPNSTISYPKSLEGLDSREIVLDGEAYFDIAHDPDRPFVVVKDGLRIDVLGTIFSLTKQASEDVLIENHEGSVKASVVVKPSEAVILNKGDKFLFDGESFTDVTPRAPKPVKQDFTKSYSLFQIYQHLYKETEGRIYLGDYAEMNGKEVVKIDLTQSVDDIIEDLMEKTVLEIRVIGEAPNGKLEIDRFYKR